MTQQAEPTLTKGEGLFNFQQRASRFFNDQGFPTKNHEAWLYWQPDTLQKTLLTPSKKEAVSPVSGSELVIENGRLTTVPEASGLSISTDMSQVLTHHNLSHTVETSSIATLNNTQFQECIAITLKESLSQPLTIHIKGTPKAHETVVSRLIIIAEEGVEATISFHHLGKGDDSAVSNTFYEIVGRKNSNVNVAHVIQKHKQPLFLSASLHFDEEAEFNSVTLVQESALTRHDSDIHFNGENVNCHFKGLAILQETDQCFNHLKLHHHVGGGESSQTFKTILCDKAVSEFSGLVFVAPGAHGTDSSQSNKNMMLSDSARVLSRPQLRIDADDVVCAHGCTIGQLNPVEIHYIRSRGLTHKEAQSLLLFGYAEDIIQDIEDETLKSSLTAEMKTITKQLNPYVA